MTRPTPHDKGLTATSEMILVLGMILIGLFFLPIAGQFIGGEATGIMGGIEENLATEMSDRITHLAGQRNERSAVTYEPPVSQYELEISDNREITVDVPGVDTQTATLEDVYMEDTSIENADSLCIIRNYNLYGIQEGPCCPDGSDFPEERPH